MLVNCGPLSVRGQRGTPTYLKNLQKVLIVLRVVVSPLQGTMTGHPESRSTMTREDFPATVKKSVETDSKGLVGVLSHMSSSCC